jgi:hypothetical protein
MTGWRHNPAQELLVVKAVAALYIINQHGRPVWTMDQACMDQARTSRPGAGSADVLVRTASEARAGVIGKHAEVSRFALIADGTSALPALIRQRCFQLLIVFLHDKKGFFLLAMIRD